MPSLRIFDRGSFSETLLAAQMRTQQLQKANPSWDLAQRIAQQLAMVGQRTAALETTAPGTVTQANLEAPLHCHDIDLGPLSARNFDDAHGDYAGLLKEVDYAFRRYGALTTSDPLIGGRRRGILQAMSGRDAFRKHIVKPDRRIVLGRGEHSDMMLHDKTLAPRHLEVWWDGIVAHVRTLSERLGATSALSVNGTPALRAELRNGDVVRIGESTLRFFVEHYSACTEDRRGSAAALDPAAQRQLLEASWSDGTLYAVADAARDRAILPLLEESVDNHASLYEGAAGRTLDDQAPYLIHFSPDSSLFERWLRSSVGRAWGLFVHSRSSAKLVRRALRRLLMVEAQGRRDPLYFRFYDPRVMAQFWPLSTTRQRSEMLDGIDALYFEDERGQLVTAQEEAAQEEAAQEEAAQEEAAQAQAVQAEEAPTA